MVTQISSNVNSTEINGIATRAINSITNSGTTDVVVIGTKDKIENDNNNLTLAMNKKQGSEATPFVQLLEAKRDKGLKSIFKTVDGACYRLVDDVEAAGKMLKEVIKRHGSTMYDLPQDEQTAVMSSFFKELETPAMVAALELAGVTTHVAETKAVNQLYLAEVGKRSSSSAKLEEPQLVGENAKKVKVNLNKLMNYLDSYLEAKEDATLRTLYTELCEIIDQANAIIKSRITRKKSGEKETGTEPADETKTK